MATVREHYNFLPQQPVNTREFICGCEFEIEDVINKYDVDKVFIVETDHSLRNNGWEFKTLPNTYNSTLELFKRLHTTLKLGKEPFSDRTSIHVHVNVRELQLAEVRQLILTYALLEPLFFEFVGQTRKNSIFCVPLNYTYIPSLYHKSSIEMHKKWHKYTAFNIVPMGPFGDNVALGTVEFRHLYGTADEAVFSKWLSSIKELYTFIEQANGFDLLKHLEKGIALPTLAMAVVPSLALAYSDSAINEMLKDTLLDVKLACGGLK
jgi:hypothetical protein